MATKLTNDDEIPVRFPGALSLKDLITMVSVAVSLTIAWGVFGTRLTVVEKDVATIEAADARIEKKVDDLDTRTLRNEQKLRDNDFMIDQLYEYANKQPPSRRN